MTLSVEQWPMLVRSLALMTFTVGLARCAHPPAISVRPAAAAFAFDEYLVVTGPAESQTVLTGFLLDGAVAELMVVQVDDNQEPRLYIYGLEGRTWVPKLEASLPPTVLFVDIANIGGRDRLVTYESGRLSWFDPGTLTARALVDVTSDFEPPPQWGIPQVDVTRDLNDDGRDDLVVPDHHGFRLSIQTSDGAFADPIKIGPSSGKAWIYGRGGYRHDPWLQGGIHQMDYDGDGRRDLVFWNRYRFEVHQQDERGMFATDPKTFTVDVALDGGRNPCSRRPEHGFDSFRACYESDHSSLTTGDRKEKVVQALTDLDKDGFGDLVVYSLEGTNVLNVHSAYEVHFGGPTPDGGTTFASSVGAAIPSDGVQMVMEAQDLDGDGLDELMLTTIHLGFFKVLGSLLTRSISLGLDFYRMEGGSFGDEPNATRKIKLDLSRRRQSSVLVGDVNGDGLSDLLVGKGRKELQVFAGVPGPELFAREPRKLSIDIPNDERYTWLTDLDQDGKQDIVIHHPSRDEPHRLTVLLAR